MNFGVEMSELSSFEVFPETGDAAAIGAGLGRTKEGEGEYSINFDGIFLTVINGVRYYLTVCSII